MKKLIKGVLEFRRTVLPTYRDTFRKLALEQKPDTFFIACSDSRVVPNLFASTDPGDLFVSRNVGNLIPAHAPEPLCEGDHSVRAALEFAVVALNVTHIVVCGHSECGAIQSLVDRTQLPTLSGLDAWLCHAAAAKDKLAAYPELAPELPLHNRLSQANVLVQIDHLKSYPFVRERVESGTLHLHAWWFDIGNADVRVFRPELNSFVLIDELDEAEALA